MLAPVTRGHSSPMEDTEAAARTARTERCRSLDLRVVEARVLVLGLPRIWRMYCLMWRMA